MCADRVSKGMDFKLDYNSLKVKKTWKMKLMGLGGKIDKANESIKAACGESNKGDTKANEGVKEANIGADQSDEAVYQVAEAETDVVNGESQAADGEADVDEGQNQANVGQSIIDESPSIESMQAATNAKIAAMTEGLSGQQEEVMTRLQEKMEILAEAGEQLAANAEEVGSLQAELAEITADSAEGGEFSTGMAAAGGQNSAYSLSVPTGPAKAPKAGQAKKGGLISSGAQQTPQAQGTQQGQQAQGGQNADAAKTARAQEIYARLVEINEQNCTIQDTITTASEEAMNLQTTVTELMETQTTEVTEDQANAEAGNEQSMKTLATFQDIYMTGSIITATGAVIKGVGNGISAVGTTVAKSGETVQQKGGIISTLGKFFRGVFKGVKITGQVTKKIPYAHGIGFTIEGTGKGGEKTGDNTDKQGKGIKKEGKVVAVTGQKTYDAGRDVHKVGKWVQLGGQGVQTIGSAGTMVAGIQQGNWSAIIGGAIGFLGTAATCIGNASEFATAIGIAKDGFFAICTNIKESIDEVISSDTLSKLTSKGQKVANDALQNGTGGFGDMVTNVAATFISETSAIKPNKTNTTDNNTTSTAKEESSKPTVQVETKTSTPAMKAKARNAGLTDDQINGKSDSEIQKLIDEKNATNKPKVK